MAEADNSPSFVRCCPGSGCPLLSWLSAACFLWCCTRGSAGRPTGSSHHNPQHSKQAEAKPRPTLFCTDRSCEANALQNDLLKRQLPTTFTVITGVFHRHCPYTDFVHTHTHTQKLHEIRSKHKRLKRMLMFCLLYTSDAADEQ